MVQAVIITVINYSTLHVSEIQRAWDVVSLSSYAGTHSSKQLIGRKKIRIYDGAFCLVVGVFFRVSVDTFLLHGSRASTVSLGRYPEISEGFRVS